jgi:dihydroneopterin aldolase
MDQYAHLVASRLAGATIVDEPDGIRRALASGQVPVLAPSRWLQEADPVPHSWDVTSDSIAAWVAGQVGATELLLIKPPHARGDSLVDRFFSRALPATVTVRIVPADQVRLSTAGPHTRTRPTEQS